MSSLYNLNVDNCEISDFDYVLKAYKQSPDNFDLIITDMTMPHMTGVEFSKEVLKINKEMDEFQ